MIDRYVAIDPGGETGWVCLDIPEGSSVLDELPNIRGGELGPEEHHWQLYHMLTDDWCRLSNYDQGYVTIIYEGFIYRNIKHKGVEMPGIPLISKEYIGIIKLIPSIMTKDYRPTLVRQLPAQAVGDKAFWHNDKLKKLGLYTKGERHRNDATRHLLTYLLEELNYRELLNPLHPSWNKRNG